MRALNKFFAKTFNLNFVSNANTHTDQSWTHFDHQLFTFHSKRPRVPESLNISTDCAAGTHHADKVPAHKNYSSKFQTESRGPFSKFRFTISLLIKASGVNKRFFFFFFIFCHRSNCDKQSNLSHFIPFLVNWTKTLTARNKLFQWLNVDQFNYIRSKERKKKCN